MKMSEALYSKTKAEGLGNEIENELKRSAVEVQTLRDETYAAIKKTYEEGQSRKMEKEMKKLKKFSEQSENEVRQKLEELYKKKGLKRGAQNLKGFQSKIVDFEGVSGSLGKDFSKMLATGEQYIGDKYRMGGGEGGGSRDCSHFVSKLLSTFFGKNMYLTSKGFYDTYKGSTINRNNIRAGDIMYQKGHVEMIVGKPFIENGHIYIMTIGSSTDKYNIAPMFDENKNPIKNKDGVGYRKREIFPKNSNKYTFLRPPYESWDGKDS